MVPVGLIKNQLNLKRNGEGNYHFTPLTSVVTDAEEISRVNQRQYTALDKHLN